MSSKRKFEVEIPPGTRLDESKDLAGAYRGTLRSNKDNSLVGHANFREVTDDDDEDSDSNDGLSGALVGLALAGLTVAVTAGIAGVVGNRERRRREELEAQHRERELADAEEERLHQKKQRRAAEKRAKREERKERRTRRRIRKWEERAAQEGFSSQVAASQRARVARTHAQWRPGWYDDGSGQWRWWDGVGWTHQTKPMAVAGNVPARSDSQPTVAMSSAEWQARVQAMLLSRAFSDEQLRLLSQARISDANAQVLEAQRDLQTMSPQQLSSRISALIGANPALKRAVQSVSAPGWYDDGHNRMRWWDGHNWTEHIQGTRGAPRQLNQGEAASPGWYPDAQGMQRWWDGRAWTEQVRQERVRVSNPKSTAKVQPGWYVDADGQRRWWDGHRWSEQKRF